MKRIFHRFFRVMFPHLDPMSVKHKYHLPESIGFSLHVKPDGWLVVTMPDHPGLITQANSQQGLIEMVNDAVLTYYDVPKREADVVYDRLNVGDAVITYQGQLQMRHA